MAQMDNMMKYALIAVGGYLLYEHWSSLTGMFSSQPQAVAGGTGQPVYTGPPSSGTTSGQTQTPTQTTNTSGGTSQQQATNTNNSNSTSTVPPPPPTVNTIDKLIMIKAAMSAAGNNPDQNNYSPDQYNYYYNQMYGTAPSPESIGLTHDTMPITTWWAHMQTGGFGGLGHIAYRNPYRNPTGRPFGSNIAPLGSEKLHIKFG
jgi:hypothetical protein